MVSTINFTNYYNENHEYAFLTNAIELFDKTEFIKNLDNFNFIEEKDEQKREKKLYDLRLYIMNNLDELNFSIVRLAIILELALKGISIHKKLNIFSLKDMDNLINLNTVEKSSIRSKGLKFLINNLNKILDDSQCQKYKNSFEFFNNKRNEFIHFSFKDYDTNEKEIIESVINLKQFMGEVVNPLLFEVSSIEAKV